MVSSNAQVGQLQSAALVLLRRKLEVAQRFMELEQQWERWRTDWPHFMVQYWPHCDPERRCTRQELEARLEVLQQSDPDDYAAMIAKAALYERLGRFAEAMNELTLVMESNTPFTPTALILSAKVKRALGKLRQEQDALKQAAALGNPSPVDRWLLAQLALSDKRFADAEQHLRELIDAQQFELTARRYLALVLCARPKPTRASPRQAVHEAKSALLLDPRPDWFSYFVLAQAFANQGQTEEALKNATEAKSRAKEEHVALCESLITAIQDGVRFPWDFDRRAHVSDANPTK